MGVAMDITGDGCSYGCITHTHALLHNSMLGGKEEELAGCFTHTTSSPHC